jgi:hypothetical protein
MKYYANHVYKLTIGSYYDLSMKKIGNLSNPFILFYVMMVGYISFQISYNNCFSEAEYREFVINKILKDESNL